MLRKYGRNRRKILTILICAFILLTVIIIALLWMLKPKFDMYRNKLIQEERLIEDKAAQLSAHDKWTHIDYSCDEKTRDYLKDLYEEGVLENYFSLFGKYSSYDIKNVYWNDSGDSAKNAAELTAPEKLFLFFEYHNFTDVSVVMLTVDVDGIIKEYSFQDDIINGSGGKYYSIEYEYTGKEGYFYVFLYDKNADKSIIASRIYIA